MKLLVFFLFYTILPGIEVQEVQEAQDNNNQTIRKLIRKKRILGGEDVNPGTAIFMASLQRRSDRAHVCAGSLITLRHLITTCSCVSHSYDSSSGLTTALPEGHIVIAGSANNWQLEEAHTRNVSRFEADYRCRYNIIAGMWEYNIGYITVSHAYEFMDEKLGLIKNLHHTQYEFDKDFAALMAEKELQEGGKEYCHVYGWGASTKTKNEEGTFDVGGFTAQLKLKAVQHINQISCKARICGIGNGACTYELEPNKCFCMVSAGMRDGPLCDADNGTPLMCKDRLWGVGEMLFECGLVKASLFFKLDIDSINHYIFSSATFPKIDYLLIFILAAFITLQ
ncbi:uncharacterized protein LOC112126179 [Cimex lectularius]|uniref:Peptidase S1 domain-containing protein n=1 Tax=Cimex lectularius TaxID=79782 RepID=A0A8I6SRG1_CIMLE|nr:uncharacterized protein LOC112126179 [Cimex lectularius]